MAELETQVVAAKRSYQAPKLEDFGAVVDMTLNASGSGADGGATLTYTLSVPG